MLIQFTVGNFLSFKDRVTLDMRTTALHELPENVFKIQNDTELFKSVAVYGANASGKSNLIKAFSFFREFVIWSYRDIQGGEKIDVLNFVLNDNSKTQPSFFEIVINTNSNVYRYSFEVDKEKVVSEKLFLVLKTTEIELFTRDSNGYKIADAFKEGTVDLQVKTKNNCLFMSVVAQFNGKISNEIIECLRKFRVSSTVGYRGFYNRTISRLEDKDGPQLKQNVLDFISVADNTKDFEIETRTEQKDDPNKPGLKEVIRKFVFFVHEVFNDKKEPTGKVRFELNYLESEGTRKMFSLSVPIIDAIKNGEVIIIDELENHLHPLMFKHIIKLFNSNSNNKAQLIFATHNLTCMNNECFRRDQIWFTEKNDFGESSLFSLADIKTNDNKKVRNDARYSNDYLMGKYGAVPFIKEIDNLFKEKENEQAK